ncbi:recombinase family protein [Lawsonibacter sp.]|uniref:recombinase family protein n=1 Tax=Lawsonibacter sp. TaxID=2185275 RepID=UPI00258465F6|nr:recombinase family protein [Lawsonibacter sp.]MCI6397651.1 recombinase family protein [Lawsonibacter sp.]MDY2977679.1 recombinase family protein [Oscillospiraceae bacterium]
MVDYRLGKYIRLSQADMDLSRKEGKTESDSIAHQRDLINRFIDSHPEFAGCPQSEFFDDGYSGTNFDRPSFEKLLEKIKTGEINCVIVKDFSRFGRNYIELGDYLERIFPFLGVRFISVNDQYDSNDYKGTTGGLDVVMKNIVYDYYSKDLSVKVKTAKRSKMKRGEYLGGHVPYGLRRHETIKNKLAIDPEAAVVVKQIFDYALTGMNAAAIAKRLNEDKILTPGQYYLQHHPQSKKFKNSSSQLYWTSYNVLNVLRQEMYYGAVVGHKRTALTVGGKHTAAVPKEEQIIVEGMHEAIISKEVFLEAQKVIRKVKPRNTGDDSPHLFRGIVRCGSCGRVLMYYRKAKRPYFVCAYTKQTNTATCYSGKIYEDIISETVWQALQQFFTMSEKLEKRLQKRQSSLGNEQEACALQIADLQRKLDKANTDKFANIDRYMAGSMDKATYLKKREELTSQIEQLEKQIAALENKAEELRATDSSEVSAVLKPVHQYEKAQSLTREMILAFIKAVYVTDNEHIEIEWNFSDMFKQILGNS